MPNYNGNVTVINLKLVDSLLGDMHDANGDLITKPNPLPGQTGHVDHVPNPDYVLCPLTKSTKCPVIYATALPGKSIEFEFTLDTAVAKNPDILVVQVKLTGGVKDLTVPYLLDKDDPQLYFHDSFDNLVVGTSYILTVNFFKGGNVVVGSACGTGEAPLIALT